jgi:hypothetical protein
LDLTTGFDAESRIVPQGQRNGGFADAGGTRDF